MNLSTRSFKRTSTSVLWQGCDRFENSIPANYLTAGVST